MSNNDLRCNECNSQHHPADDCPAKSTLPLRLAIEIPNNTGLDLQLVAGMQRIINSSMFDAMTTQEKFLAVTYVYTDLALKLDKDPPTLG